jgi:hypothetical protein
MIQPQREYSYRFTFEDKNSKKFTVILDGKSRLVKKKKKKPPSWTLLEHHQCSPCTLGNTNGYCPVAVNISELVSTFIQYPSHKKCTVSCRSPERLVSKDTTVQKGLSSILGLLMATSGCPVMDFLRPLARFHLPFATVDESVFRSVAAYLLRQYFLKDDKQQVDFELNNILDQYEVVKKVNKGMLERIRDISVRDADQNAIVTLNSLAQILEMEIETNLESLRHYFVDT